jgi:flagellar protein FlbD
MIAVTRLNGTRFHVNALLIETVEETPDTLLTLTTGKKFIVLESASDVTRSIQQYLSTIGFLAASAKPPDPESEGASS